jgi:DNA-directed RNA polymerase subunit RPC12/RpoP
VTTGETPVLRCSQVMGLKFNCSNPECRRRVEVEDALAGTDISCPACGSALHVPVSHDIRFTCRTPACDQHIVVDVSEAGRAVKCPACGRPQRVPGDPPKPLVPEPPPTPVRRAEAAGLYT